MLNINKILICSILTLNICASQTLVSEKKTNILQSVIPVDALQTIIKNYLPSEWHIIKTLDKEIQNKWLSSICFNENNQLSIFSSIFRGSFIADTREDIWNSLDNTITPGRDNVPHSYASSSSSDIVSPDGRFKTKKAIYLNQGELIINDKNDQFVKNVCQPVSGKFFSFFFSPDSKYLIVTEEAQPLRIFKTNEDFQLLQASFPVSTIALYTPDGKHLVIADSKGTIYFYDSTTFEQLLTLKNKTSINCLRISHDGMYLAAAWIDGFKSVSKSVITIWEKAVEL